MPSYSHTIYQGPCLLNEKIVKMLICLCYNKELLKQSQIVLKVYLTDKLQWTLTNNLRISNSILLLICVI